MFLLICIRVASVYMSPEHHYKSTELYLHVNVVSQMMQTSIYSISSKPGEIGYQSPSN